MPHLFQPDECVAAASLPELAAELAGFAPGGMSVREAKRWANELKVIDPAPTTRARLLGELVYPNETPSAQVVQRELISRWIQRGDADVLCRGVEADRSCPVVIDSKLWSVGAIVADWGFVLDFIVNEDMLGWFTVIVPADARWVLCTGIEEHIRVFQPSFARIRELIYAPRSEIRPGMVVPKAQCQVAFDDGTSWESEPILGAAPRGVALGFLDFLGACTGLTPVEVEVLREPASDRPV